MKWMFAIAPLLGALALPALQAGEREMQQVLAQWNQQMAEYQAAMSVAASDEQRAGIAPPAPEEIAPALWKAVRARTGTREETLPPSRKQGQRSAPQTRQFRTYEFEKEWAAPAVIWFINHPDAFAKLFENDPNRLTYFAEALLDSVHRVHFSHPQIAEACAKLAESTSSKVFEIAEKIYTRNTEPAARGCAALALSCMLANPALAASEGGAARTRSKRIYYIKQALNLAPEKTRFGSVSLTEAAEEEIYRLRNLAAGMAPPQLHVTSPDGKAATFPVLGKPNLIFFWSPGEDVGLSIMSKQTALMTRYPDLVLCPIVPHMEAAELQRLMQEHRISTCYMDNAEGSGGLAYRVRQLPMVALVNEKARLLYIGYPNLQLQTELDNLFNKTAAPEAKPAAPEAKPAAAPTPAAAPAPPSPPAQGTPPAPAASDTPPALRPMPEF